MLFIETPIFTKRVKSLMSDEEYRELQQSLADNPEQGALIRKGGGIRKVRWARDGQGKSGSFRVIYYFVKAQDQQRMLFIFGKNEQSNLSDEQLSQLRRILERW